MKLLKIAYLPLLLGASLFPISAAYPQARKPVYSSRQAAKGKPVTPPVVKAVPKPKLPPPPFQPVLGLYAQFPTAYDYNYCTILEDTTQKLTIAQVGSDEYAYSFKPNHTLQQGLKPGRVYWVRMKFFNYMTHDAEWWLNPGWWDEAELYEAPYLDAPPKRTGLLVPMAERDVKRSRTAISLMVHRGQVKLVYMRLKSNYTLYQPAMIAPYLTLVRPLLEDERSELYYQGAFFGIMLALILYNLLIFASARDLSYLFYVIYILGLALVALLNNGYGFEYHWGAFPALNRYLYPLSYAVVAFGFLQFTRLYLNTRKLLPRYDLVLLVLIGASLLIAMLTGIGDFDFVSKLASLLSPLYTIVSFVVGVRCLLMGQRTARYFVAANAFVWVGLILFSLGDLGFTPHSFWNSYYITEIGAVFAVIIFSLGLTDRLNVLTTELSRRALEKERLEREKEQERQRMIERQKEELEVQVAERTLELRGANEELQTKNKLIEEVNHDLTESIRYAKRIQTAILPEMNVVRGAFGDSFILHMSKDIVSGDFYWLDFEPEGEDGLKMIAAVDCTGHGVPGAFMSLIGYTLLNRAVQEQHLRDPAVILTELDRTVKAALRQNMAAPETRDGMDIALCALDARAGILKFAGSYRPLFLVRNGVIEEFPGNRFSVGGGQAQEKNFGQQVIQTQPGDMYYMFSDGFVDQFGGDLGRKFTMNRFRRILMEIQHLDMDQQKARLEVAFHNWRGRNEQIDDVLVIGFRT